MRFLGIIVVSPKPLHNLLAFIAGGNLSDSD